MTTLRRFWFFLTRWRRVADLDDEMRLHVELRAAANRRSGLTPDDALREAQRRFGNALKLREESRDMWGFSRLETLAGDVHLALRQVIRRPSSTVVVVLTLALGVGANTAVFTLVDAMLFRPASWDHGTQLVWVASFQGRADRVGGMSYPDYIRLRDQPTTTSALLAYGGGSVSVGGSRPRRVLGGLVSGNYFDVLGIPAAVGRTFTADEDSMPGAHPVVVLSDALWKDHFGARADIVNTDVAINGTPFTIIGVAPPGFTGVTYASNAEHLWMPLAMQSVAMPRDPGLLQAPDTEWLRVAGRLRRDSSLEGAEAEMRLLVRQLNAPATPPEREKAARLIPVRGGLSPWEQRDLGPVFGLIALVPALILLVACANVANVLLARNLSRSKELAMRRAVGASRGRLVRLLFAESLVIAVLSGAAGFSVAFGLIALIVRYGNVPAEVSLLLAPDQRALAATMTLGIVTTFIFGLAPALTSTKFDVLPVLKDDGATATASRAGRRLRGALVIAQVAVSLALVITAALLLQSLAKAMRIDPGFDPRGAITVSFDPVLQGYTPAGRDAFISQLVEGVLSIPGASSAALTSSLPLGGRFYSAAILAEGTTTLVQALVASVSPSYFTTLRLPLMSGRDFDLSDTREGPRVAIVNERLAGRLWPGTNPIGMRVTVDSSSDAWREVVGVVRDSKYASLTETPRSGLYVPLAQRTDSPLSLVVRAAGDPGATLTSVADVARRLDADLALFAAETLEHSVHRSTNLRRASASMFAVFGIITLVLAAIGVYGVAAHSVSRRIREVGIRMSLGARASDVLRMFAVESLRLSFYGVGIGLFISVLVSRLLRTFLFGLTSTDVMTFVSGSVFVGVVCAIATYIPARRGARVQPMTALRHN